MTPWQPGVQERATASVLVEGGDDVDSLVGTIEDPPGSHRQQRMRVAAVEEVAVQTLSGPAGGQLARTILDPVVQNQRRSVGSPRAEDVLRRPAWIPQLDHPAQPSRSPGEKGVESQSIGAPASR